MLSPNLKDAVEVIFKHNMNILLVGGAVRSYLSNGEIARDIDAELRPVGDASNWNHKLDLLKSDLKKLGLFILEAGVGVFKIKVGDYELELSTPRTEVFRTGEWGHSNFNPIFDPTLSFEEAFKRRDFTINAIGLLLSKSEEAQYIDPFAGLNDLESKKLRPVSNSFHLDPVRVLRAIRFHLTLDFQMTDELSSELEKANLSELSSHYLGVESKKARVLRFMALFFELAKKYKWSLPESLQRLDHLKWSEVKSSLHDDTFTIYLLLFSIGADVELAINFAQLISLKHKEIKNAWILYEKMNQGETDLDAHTRHKLSNFQNNFLNKAPSGFASKLISVLDD